MKKRSEPDGEQGARPSVERAEEMVDHLGQRVGQMGAEAGQRLLRLAARTREEAEDIWAEAQSIRRRD
jgi:hypothetical protein